MDRSLGGILGLAVGVATLGGPSYGAEPHEHTKSFYKTFTDTKELEKELKTCAESSDGYVRLSDILFEKKDIAHAGEAARKAWNLNSQNSDAAQNLAVYLIKQKDFDQANLYASLALKFAQDDEQKASAYTSLACVSSNKDNFAKARFYLDEAIKLKPENQKYRRLRAKVSSD